MTSFKDLPIQHKLVIAFALTTAIALVLAASFFAFSTWINEKEKATAELQAIADLISANSTAALTFEDKTAATEILYALDKVPDIIMGILYDDDGHEFVRYIDNTIQAGTDSVSVPNIHLIATNQSDISVSSVVTLDNQPIGSVVLYGTLQTRILKLQDQLLTVLITMILCFIIAVIIAWRLQRVLTDPVRDLTKTMLHVSSNHDYSIRSSVNTNDELGVLAQGINEMLARVEERDKQLIQHQRELEKEVERRTLDLQDANQMLRKELSERVRYQEELSEAHTALEQHSKQISLLSEMNERIQACHTMNETRPVLAYYVCQLFPASTGALYVFNKTRSLVESMVRWGNPAVDETVFKQDDCWALRQGSIHAVHDPDNGLLCIHYQQIAKGPYLCAPMIAYGEVIGVLHLQFQPECIELDKSQKFAVNVAEQLGLALANLKLREALTEQSVRDPLTGLFNRRFMQESLEREIARAQRMNSKVGIIMLDIDHFKKFNDSYGHEAGDVVIKSVSAFLQKSIRNYDIACRFGGEEFIVILPSVEQDLVMKRAEEIRAGIKAMHIQYGSKYFDNLTVSLGVALSSGESIDELLKIADDALYQAKNNGRDCVVLGGKRSKDHQQKPELSAKN